MRKIQIIFIAIVCLSNTIAAAEISVKTMPPSVVKTVPAAGDTSVSPSLKEIRVTFSKIMKDGAWSWVKVSDETFPEMTGVVKYAGDKKTCVLPVKLVPGKTYVIWINRDKFNKFMDEDGLSAVPYLLVFQTRK